MAAASPYRRAIWQSICQIAKENEDGFMTVAQILHHADKTLPPPLAITSNIVANYCRLLVVGGFLELRKSAPAKARGGSGYAVSYRLVRKAGEAPVLQKDGSPSILGRRQENIWRTLRMVNYPQTLIEITAHAMTPDLPIKENSALAYLVILVKCGIVEEVKTPKKTSKFMRKFILRAKFNTGPLPPVITAAQAIYDQNTKKLLQLDLADEREICHE